MKNACMQGGRYRACDCVGSLHSIDKYIAIDINHSIDYYLYCGLTFKQCFDCIVKMSTYFERSKIESATRPRLSTIAHFTRSAVQARCT